MLAQKDEYIMDASEYYLSSPLGRKNPPAVRSSQGLLLAHGRSGKTSQKTILEQNQFFAENEKLKNQLSQKDFLHEKPLPILTSSFPYDNSR